MVIVLRPGSGPTAMRYRTALDALRFECAVHGPDSRSLTAAPRPWELPLDDVLAVSRARRGQELAGIGGG